MGALRQFRFKQISMLEDLSPEHVHELAQRHFTMKPIREDPQTSYQWCLGETSSIHSTATKETVIQGSEQFLIVFP